MSSRIKRNMKQSKAIPSVARKAAPDGDRRPTEERQAELIDAALRIIETRGIVALSTRTLAAEVKLSGGAIFRHFSSLDSLLDAVVGRVEAVLDATYPAQDLAPRERLLAFIELRSGAVGKERGILRLMLSEQFALALPHDGAKRLGACVEKSWSFIVACVREGQQLGTIRSDINPLALSVVIVGVIQALALSQGPLSALGRGGSALVREGLASLLSAEPAVPKSAAQSKRRKK